MNKLVKGAVATAAGVALLMGGAGTFAYWNDSVGVSGATITAGNLKVADSGTAGTWTVLKNGSLGTGAIGTVGASAVAVSDISTFVASPGDTLTYTKTVRITASGNNLTAKLAISDASILPVTEQTPGANRALADYLTKTASITATGTGISTKASDGTYTITPSAGPITASTVTVTVVINFPKDSKTFTGVTSGANKDSDAVTRENALKLGSVDLSGLTVTLSQQ